MRFLYQLPSSVVAAGATDTIPLRGLPKAQFGRIVHLKRLIFKLNFTPTTTALPTMVQNHNLVKNCDIWDGRINRFVGGFNALRTLERIRASRVRLPDPQTNTASGTARYVSRVWHCGPPQSIGGDTDWLIPCGALENGEIRITYGALTDLAADCTAVTGLLKVYAECVVMDEVRIPPALQFLTFNANSADYQMPGRALFMSLFMLNSSSFDAIAAGDFGNIRLDLGGGDVVPSIPTYALQSAFQDDMEVVEATTFEGEPRGSSDINSRQVNHGSSTALATADNDLQAVIWTPKRGKMTKQPLAEASARLIWDGSQSSAFIAVERILAQSATVVSQMGGDALRAISRGPGRTLPKTVSKVPYTGPLAEFFPWQTEVGA